MKLPWLSVRPLAVFALRFALIYGLLLAPWPGWRGAYGRYLQAFGNTWLAHDDDRGLVLLRAAVNPPRTVIDTEILFHPAAPVGVGPVAGRILGLDSRSVGWVPTALCLALILATPLPGLRRLGALALGLLALHGYVLLVLAVYLWNQSHGAMPVSFLPYDPALGDGLEETLVTQLGPSFVVPVVTWVVVSFRAADWRLLPGRVVTAVAPVRPSAL